MRDIRTTRRSNAKGDATPGQASAENENLCRRPRLKDVLTGCNRRALLYSKKVEIAATPADWLDHHEQTILGSGQRWIRRLIAVLLLPIGFIAMGSLVYSLARKGAADTHLLFSVPVWYTLMGILIWGVLYVSKIFHSAFLYIYVYGHELTHLISIRLSGGSVSDFKVSMEGGHVITDKNNMFIALSPYFIPIWVIAWLLLAAITSLFIPFNQFSPVVFAGIGFWWTFHFYWTIWIIPKDQPDLNENGTFFSLMIIYLSNLALIISSLFLIGAVAPKQYIREFLYQGEIFIEFLREGGAWLNSLF